MKRIVLLLLCLLLVPSTVVSAASTASFLNFCEVTEDTLYLYGKELPQGGSVTVTVDSQVISGGKSATVAEEKIPVTVYCLVDITSDMTEAQVKQQKDVLNTISSRMGPEDRMVIATMADTFSEGQPLTTLESRKTAIDTLQRKSTNPKLFDAVSKALHSLETKTTFTANRCLVVLADGFYDDKDSVNEQQLWDRIRNSRIPIFGISVTKYANSPYALEYANIIHRMGLESIGGFGVDPVNEGISAASAAESVWTAIQNGFVVSIPAAQIESRRNDASVNIVYETRDARMEDSMSIDLAGLPLPETEPTEEETIPTETEPVDDSKKSGAVILSVAGVAVVAILGAVLVILRKKKQQATSDEAPVIIEMDQFVTSPVNTTPVETQPVMPRAQETQKEDVMVHFVAILHPDIVCSFGLTTHVSKTVGRSSQSDVCLNSADSKLSGKHCVVEWDGKDLYLKDIGSTNGTSVNGAPIKPNTWHRIPFNTKVRLGEYEYRVSMELI